jgi:hypothetical protein
VTGRARKRPFPVSGKGLATGVRHALRFQQDS